MGGVAAKVTILAGEAGGGGGFVELPWWVITTEL